jgi:hypothetical protein
MRDWMHTDDYFHWLHYLKFSLQVAYLALIGGVAVKDCTFRVMHALLKHSLALQLTWCEKNSDKYGFGELELKKVVVG